MYLFKEPADGYTSQPAFNKMTNEARIHQITAAVRSTFPGFEITVDMEGLPTVIFGFLTDHLVRAFRAGDTSVVMAFMDFVNDLSRSDDFIVRSCLDELILSLYSEAGDVYTGFRKQLPVNVSEYFSKVIHLWISGNEHPG